MVDAKKSKIDFDHLDKYIKDKDKAKQVKAKYEKVKHLIRSDIAAPVIDDMTGAVEIIADSPRRIANGYPPMQILNPDLEAALDDIITLAGVQ